MTQKVDLGRSLLRIRGSQLQLSLITFAQFSQSPSHGTTFLSPDLKLEDIWITEALELDLRFFIGSNWSLGDAVASFISRLEPQLSGLKIWSDLGLSARLKSTKGDNEDAYVSESDTSGPRCLNVGLCRGPRKMNPRKRCTLPAMIINAPDACPPVGTPALILNSLDIFLEYGCHVESTTKSLPSKLDKGFFEQDPSVIAIIQALDDTVEHIVAVSEPNDTLSRAIEGEAFIQSSGAQPSQRDLMRLFDLGLRRLFMSNAMKDSTVHISDHIRIRSLSTMVPAVFNSAYREAMNQRTVSIPKITKALSSMIEGNDNHSIRAKVIDLLHYTESSRSNAVTINAHPTSLRVAIHSSLWHVAQENLQTLTLSSRRTSVLPTDLPPEKALTSEDTVDPSIPHHQQPNIEFLLPDHSLNIQRNGDDTGNEWIADGIDLESDFEALSVGEDSPDTGDSTQAFLDNSYSTISSSRYICTDDDMMFNSEYGDATSHPYPLRVTNDSWEVAEYIGSPDSDLMLDDEF